jgi:hypothetical protein
MVVERFLAAFCYKCPAPLHKIKNAILLMLLDPRPFICQTIGKYLRTDMARFTYADLQKNKFELDPKEVQSV